MSKALTIAMRDGYSCFYCGRANFSGEGFMEKPQVDHVVPRCRGGSDHPENLVLSCRKCNSSKCAKPGWTFVIEKWAGVSISQARQAERVRNILRSTRNGVPA